MFWEQHLTLFSNLPEGQMAGVRARGKHLIILQSISSEPRADENISF